MIEVNNLTKSYNGHLAVDHLSFTLEAGKIYGFLGPNGAGKSTTMNMLTGYLAPTEGSIVINGFDILEEPEEARKCIGYLPELPPLYMDMTAREYLDFVAGLKKIPKKDAPQAIERAMEIAGITHVQDRLNRNLSKGYKQRVGLAQAVLGLPPIIILDEPTVGLDPIQIIEMRDTIRELAKDHTILLSSHILSEVSAICDHIMILSHGQLVASDTPENLAAAIEGNNSLSLTVKGEEKELEHLLSSIKNISNYTIAEPETAVSEEVSGTDSESELTKSVSRMESESVSGKANPGTDSESTAVKKTSFEKAKSDSQLVSAEIEYSKSVEIRDELFYALAQAQMPIYKLEVTSRSLEDIFIELTENDLSNHKVNDSSETEHALPWKQFFRKKSKQSKPTSELKSEPITEVPSQEEQEES